MKTIGIFTPYSLTPYHPRLESIITALDKADYEVSLHQSPIKASILKKLLNLLVLNFVDLYSVLNLAKKTKQVDVVFIQSFRYLPLAIFARYYKKKVIYETLDNNIHLWFYYLVKQFPFLQKLPLAINTFENFEKKLVFRFTDKVIVNSAALMNYFGHRASLIYYTSPLENICQKISTERPTCLIYIGWFCEMKGAYTMIKLAKQLKLRLIVYGRITEEKVKGAASSEPLVTVYGHLSSTDLKKELPLLFSKYNAVGLSLTNSVNHSNATQEINKDIDYMALGIPIIGNSRGPTAEKINNGCGLFYEDLLESHTLIEDTDRLSKISKQEIKLYNQRYSTEQFEDQINRVILEIL
ncbi:glycosyltransferase family protein [Alkalimarinus alittae]|uniref:Glycosyltransferase n=1 Tax=Alkalimarinus alittae TaxID=2961619 RepID=A0ABY6MZ88_9ALTE|nr:hypothetical protein [Alkalimarinus alittae]UZE95156.1 hypothetical protein NKI27_13915 [Alkalimarinus alittae]